MRDVADVRQFHQFAVWKSLIAFAASTAKFAEAGLIASGDA